MANKNRILDKTYLSLDLAEERGILHRDYLAHTLRWSHVAKFLQRSQKYQDAVVLDAGCGKEMPLAKLLYVNKMTPQKYVGVDINSFEIPEMLRGKKIPVSIWSETDFCALDKEDVGLKTDSGELRLPNILVNFEVLEHMAPDHARAMLLKFRELTSEDCHYFISTPCWNGSAAENHINEMTYQALGSLIEDLGYTIEGVYGTFASISDYKDKLATTTVLVDNGKNVVPVTTDLTAVFAALRQYYDTNVLAIVFAPLFPESSRNCLWHLTRKQGDDASQGRLFSALEQVPGPWSQHPNWRDLAG